MSNGDVAPVFVIGVIFILLGVGVIIWDRTEKEHYFSAISHNRDTREYLDAWPTRPQFGALKLGGWIAVILGIVLLALGGVLLLLG